MNSEHFETQAIRTQTEQTQFREHSVPLYLTSSFVFEDAEMARALFADELPGNIYTRFSNPNHEELVRKMCLLEGAEDGLVTASGMAAMFSSMAGLLSSGDHLLISRAVFGSTHQIVTRLFPRWGIAHTYVDPTRPETWEAEIRPNTRMIFLETPSNPGLDLVDLEWVGKLADKYQLILNVDNCFATPYLQRPTDYGAHLVSHSATKWLDGQGRTIAGIIVGKADLLKELRFFCRHTGPALSPFNSWILSKSLETLAVRMEKHCLNAMALAEWLETLPDTEDVRYPFLPSHPQYALARKQMSMGGGLVSFAVKGGLERGRKFLDNARALSHTANLGDTRTIITHPASTTHSKLTVEEQAAVGITPGLIRISVGLEHLEDIKQAIAHALEQSR
ncbi:MAG: PLP-dependent transferase [Bacteroidetes bacterium]|nr:PLP-dependent transferase [Bacteroidota bacterium]